MIANNVQQLSKEVSPHFTPEDIAKIRKFSKQKNQVCFKNPQKVAPTYVVCSLQIMSTARVQHQNAKC